MWLDCLKDNAYETREELATDVVRVLREELHELLAAGVALVQFDEPVLTEVVFTPPSFRRSFMCGALSEKGEAKDELRFAEDLINQVIAGLPRDRTALHICRGNWTRDESALLSGDYRALGGLLEGVRVGTLFLEASTPRAGELRALQDLGLDHRIGLGVVNPRSDAIESADAIEARARGAIDLFGPDRVLLNPDCGFATFADNPVASARTAKKKLAAMAEASRRLRKG
jgi:5-methyltetrahydropteroyltriglutamate--homocysteine methyltransferase